MSSAMPLQLETVAPPVTPRQFVSADQLNSVNSAFKMDTSSVLITSSSTGMDAELFVLAIVSVFVVAVAFMVFYACCVTDNTKGPARRSSQKQSTKAVSTMSNTSSPAVPPQSLPISVSLHPPPIQVIPATPERESSNPIETMDYEMPRAIKTIDCSKDKNVLNTLLQEYLESVRSKANSSDGDSLPYSVQLETPKRNSFVGSSQPDMTESSDMCALEYRQNSPAISAPSTLDRRTPIYFHGSDFLLNNDCKKSSFTDLSTAVPSFYKSPSVVSFQPVVIAHL